MSRSVVAAVAIYACLALAGCGGSGAHDSAYVSQASAICAQELAKLNGMARPTTPAQAVSYLPDAILILRREAIRLQGVQTPPGRRAALYAALFSARQLAAVLNRFLLVLRAGTVQLSTFAQVQSQSEALRAQIDHHFVRAGLPRCVAS